MDHKELTYLVIGCAMRIHKTLGPGFLESVYQKALAHEMRKSGIGFEAEHEIRVYYDSVLVGKFFADFLAEDCLLIELKAVRELDSSHTAQLVNYLTATGIEDGLLMNFGGPSLEYKRKFRTYRPRASTTIPDSRDE